MQKVSSTDIKNYVDYINRLPGIMNSNMIFAEDEIREVHVLADTSRSSKQFAMDIQSLFMAQFDYALAEEKVNVVQIERCNQISGRSRLIIDEVCISKRRDSTQIMVALSGPDRIYEGCLACSSDKNDIARCVAETTLSAVAEAQEQKIKFTVIDVRFATVADETAVLVCISLRAPDGVTCHFCGSAFIGSDTETAIVKATLDAINRKICVC